MFCFCHVLFKLTNKTNDTKHGYVKAKFIKLNVAVNAFKSANKKVTSKDEYVRFFSFPVFALFNGARTLAASAGLSYGLFRFFPKENFTIL